MSSELPEVNPFRASRSPLPWALLLTLVALAGCGPSPRLSAEGERRCRIQAQQAFPLLRPWIAGRCRYSIEAALAAERRGAEQRRLAVEARLADLRRCQKERQAIAPLLESFAARQAEIDRLLAERYQPAAAPRPLSVDERRSLPIYDQELLDERHALDLAAWRSREEQRRSQWQSRQDASLAAARTELSGVSRQLQAIDARLLSQEAPPRLHPEQVRLRTTCGSGEPGGGGR